jgi:hypothetical protein
MLDQVETARDITDLMVLEPGRAVVLMARDTVQANTTGEVNRPNILRRTAGRVERVLLRSSNPSSKPLEAPHTIRNASRRGRPQ